MNFNLYNYLIQKCLIFCKELDSDNLSKEYSELHFEIQKFHRELNSRISNNQNISTHTIDSIDTSWMERLKIFESNLTPSSNSTALIDSTSVILEIITKIKQLHSITKSINNGHADAEKKQKQIQLYIEINSIETNEIIKSINKDATNFKKYKESLENSIKEYSKTLEKIDRETNNTQISLALKQVELNKDLSNQIERRINEIFEAKIEHIDKTYQQTIQLNSQIASKIISNDFCKSAERERKFAEALRVISILMICILGWHIYHSFNPTEIVENTQIKYLNIIKTASLSLITITLASILSREASKHRAQQYFYENQSLKISSLSPLIAELTPEKRAEVKQEVAKSLFLSEQKINFSDDSSNAIAGLTKIIEKIIDKK